MYRTLILAVALLAPFTASAAQRHVGSGQAYTTIQAAVDASSSGDVIVVHQGTYNEQVVIDSPNISSLTIKNYGYDAVTVRAPDNKVVTIVAWNTDLNLKNITVDAPYHVDPAQRAVRMASSTGLGTQVFTLTLCSADLYGDNVLLGRGVGCGASDTDVLNVKGYGYYITDFASSVGTECNYTNGWDSPLELTCNAM
jgi:hypothetical protein